MFHLSSFPLSPFPFPFFYITSLLPEFQSPPKDPKSSLGPVNRCFLSSGIWPWTVSSIPPHHQHQHSSLYLVITSFMKASKRRSCPHSIPYIIDPLCFFLSLSLYVILSLLFCHLLPLLLYILAVYLLIHSLPSPMLSSSPWRYAFISVILIYNVHEVLSSKLNISCRVLSWGLKWWQYMRKD